MHTEQQAFCQTIKGRNSDFFINKKVLDCGSLNINGDNRYLFKDCDYTGIDVGDGLNVNIVTPTHLFTAPDGSFDTIISTNCFEHDMYYEKSLQNICRLLKPKGLFLFSCSTLGTPEHGTRQSTERDSPLTIGVSEEWANYYKNLTIEDICKAINLHEIFSYCEFRLSLAPMSLKDMYFYGIKK